MEVNPDELVKLAAQSTAAAQTMAAQWTAARESLVVAAGSLGDSPASGSILEAYDTATVAAEQVLGSLAAAVMTGVSALEQAATDVREADDKATERFLGMRDTDDDGRGSGRGHGQGHGHGHGHGHGRDHDGDRHDGKHDGNHDGNHDDKHDGKHDDKHDDRDGHGRRRGGR